MDIIKINTIKHNNKMFCKWLFWMVLAIEILAYELGQMIGYVMVGAL